MPQKPENLVPKKIRRNQCLKEMLFIIEQIGPWNINCLELSKKYDFDWETIRRWYNRLILSVKPEEVKNIKIMAENSLTKNLEYLERVRADPKLPHKDRMRATDGIANNVEKLTKFLQEVGRIEKVADKLEHSGEAGIRIIGPDWWYKKDGNGDKSGERDKAGSVHSSPETTSVPPK